jgi:ATP citrate (pro-S)-lyase
MVAGGGASVIYSDTICDLGGASDLANYGEYSGAPSEQQTYEYAKTILGLMCQEKHPNGKVSIVTTNLNVWVHCCSIFTTYVQD